MKRTVIALLITVLCLSPLQAAGAWRLWLGAALFAGGAYAVVDGLTPVKTHEYGDLTNASYKVLSSDYNETPGPPYTVSSTSGIITNNGNVAMTDVTITGHYWDDQLHQVHEQSVSFMDINAGGTFFFTLPDYNSGDTLIKSIGISAAFSHETIYGYKDIDNVRNSSAVLPGVLSLIAGSYLMYTYLMDRENRFADTFDPNGLKLSFYTAPGNTRVTLTKRI